jgi:hypothetical protein
MFRPVTAHQACNQGIFNVAMGANPLSKKPVLKGVASYSGEMNKSLVENLKCGMKTESLLTSSIVGWH